MKIKHFMALAILSPLTSYFSPLMMCAQEKNLFTLEELNFGGKRYQALQPENKWYAWWGDELVRIDKERCLLVDRNTGKDIRPLTTDEDNNRKGEGKATTLVKDHQLYVVDAQGKEHQLTTDGSREIVYGSAVHRNEFGINKGTFWSPDSARLAFYRMDQSMVTDYPQVNIFPREATYEPDKYPMAGMNAHVVHVCVYDINTNKTVTLKTLNGSVVGDFVTDTKPIYFTNIAWSPDSKTVYMFELNRDQNDCRLVSYDATTGERIAELYRETSDKYVEPLHPIQFLPWDSNKFIMQSQRDGYNHLYLYNKDGKLLRQLTSGPWVVQNVLGFNTTLKSIIIEGNKYHPLHRQIYSVNVNNGKMTQLTKEDGVHRGELSASGSYVLDRHSSPTQPRNISMIDVSSAKVRVHRLFTAEDPWQNYEQPIFECGSIKAADGKTDLYYRMVKPYNFDANKKYPTVVYVYGGPHAHNVEASWHWQSRSWETYMSQKGYIVFILDNRGSEHRGRDFEQATFRQLGQIEMQDQMKGVEYLKSLPYVDANKLGVHGWSFGGFMTISLMLNYPDVFKVGVAGGPVIDWKWYEVMYGERYMDTPQQNPEGYEKTSLINKAKNLKGKLQIITGYNDNTVVPQHCLSFLDACIKAGTQPDFFAYPGQEHNMRGHASVHLHERITQYFEDYLK
ncbi:MAG: DPP IV N-terminal domain-containing protein [Prevotella sp.]|nr:DPP IV N-terminal domain-containing protein [Prevotella sp.]